MYNVLNAIVGTLMIFFGLSQTSEGYLWSALLIVGGIYVGHALTMALNDPTDQSE